MGVLAAVWMLSGCKNAEAKVTDAGLAENMQTIETTGIADDSEENVSEENTVESISDSVFEQEVIVEGNEGLIRIGTIGTPYSELLMQAKIQLAKKGWDLQFETYSDYKKINEDVLNGNLDAHLFAHQTYIDSYNDVNGTELTKMAEVCYEKYGIYSKLNKDLTNIKTSVVFGVPEESTAQAKALLYLQEAGYITLAENVGLTAIVDDVTDNPKNLVFVTYTKDTVKNVLETADYCVMGADQAILAGLEPHKEVLMEEKSSDESAKALAALLVTTADQVETEGLKVLLDILKSEEMKEYVEDTYKGALGLFP